MRIKFRKLFFNSFISLAVLLTVSDVIYSQPRTTELFTKAWHFNLSDVQDGQNPSLDDSNWRLLNLPHDWSIEGHFLTEKNKEEAAEFDIVKGEWKFSKGDDMLWKSPDLEDDSWQVVKLPAHWKEHSKYTPDNVYGWYRR